MKLAGWFDSTNGIIFGRSAGKNTNGEDQLSYRDADIGHHPPQMTILNGSFAEVSYKKSKGTLTQSLT